jgi:LysR family glycine cleavage system transcriptional activator
MSINPRRHHRPLPLEQLRAFDAVARHLSFSAAADELHLTQSAISRQIKGLEDELGAVLFQRGTRRVTLSGDGQSLLQAVAPSLERIDAAVRQIRQAKGRRTVSVGTFASFASLWLMPRLQHGFEQQHPDIDIRISASDMLVDLENADLDLVLRYCHPDEAPTGAVRLFGDVLTPVASAALLAQAGSGGLPPLREVGDLVHHTLLEQEDNRLSGQYMSWHSWLKEHGHAGLQPRRWMFMNFTYQQVQGALSGQGVALARLPMVSDAIERGELVELFGLQARMRSPYAYWLVPAQNARDRAELRAFCAWVEAQAALSRAAIGEPAQG